MNNRTLRNLFRGVCTGAAAAATTSLPLVYFGMPAPVIIGSATAALTTCVLLAWDDDGGDGSVHQNDKPPPKPGC